VRAFRARQRGEAEPPQLDSVVDELDQLAAAWRRVDELGRRLDEQRRVERDLRTEVRQLRRDLQADRARSDWLGDSNNETHRQLAESEAQRRILEERLAEARRNDDSIEFHLGAPDIAPSTPPTTGSPTQRWAGNRSQRRRAAREAKRTPLSPTE
jgi:hypothetical protein